MNAFTKMMAKAMRWMCGQMFLFRTAFHSATGSSHLDSVFRPNFIQATMMRICRAKTEGFGFGFGFSNKLIQHLSLDYKKGFYLHNTPDLMPNWQEGKDPYIQLPDIKMVYLRGLTGYRFNTNYSLNAIHSQTQAQLRSAGSLIPILSYDYYAIDNQSDETPSANSQLTRNLRVIANLGYGYTYVFAKSFICQSTLLPASVINILGCFHGFREMK